MRQGIGAWGMGVGLVFLVGCSPSKPASHSPHDVMSAMKTELAHSFAEVDAFDAMDDELAHAIGTTTVTSATIAPVAEPKPIVTWGVSPPSEEESEDLAPTRE